MSQPILGPADRKILSISSLDALRKYTCCDFSEGTMTSVGVNHVIKLCRGLWRRSGKPNEPHVMLPNSNLHSDGFLDIFVVTQYESLCNILAYHLAKLIKARLRNMGFAQPIGWVIGSDLDNNKFTQCLAKRLDRADRFVSISQKIPNYGIRQNALGSSEATLQVYERITSRKMDAFQGIRERLKRTSDVEILFAPVIGTLANLTERERYDETCVVSLTRHVFDKWPSARCPLCASGSRALGWHQIQNMLGR